MRTYRVSIVRNDGTSPRALEVHAPNGFAAIDTTIAVWRLAIPEIDASCVIAERVS